MCQVITKQTVQEIYKQSLFVLPTPSLCRNLHTDLVQKVAMTVEQAQVLVESLPLPGFAALGKVILASLSKRSNLLLNKRLNGDTQSYRTMRVGNEETASSGR